MRQPKQDGWYRRKSFPHFDLPLDFEYARELVSEPGRVASHSFRPFLGYVDKKRRFTPKAAKKYDVKKRPIKYCSHHDGYIHAYYAKQLVAAYENYLRKQPWASCVIGYRSRLGTNIHMAKNAFNEITKRNRCCAIAIDISDFFGSIDHSILITNIKRMLGTDRLSKDWHKVYKSMTQFAWVYTEDLFSKLGIDGKNPPRPLCSFEEFRKLRARYPNLVQRNSNCFGIPQGSPISAVFSNVYMVEFDANCYEYLRKISGYYRRYSDDIFIVCDQ